MFEWTDRHIESRCMTVLNECFTKAFAALDNSGYEWPTNVYDKIDAVSFTVSSNKRVKAFGRCWYTTGHIEIYPHNFKHQRLEDLVDTIKHEFVHHLTYILYGQRGHCSEWKKLCKVIGCDHMATHIK